MQGQALFVNRATNNMKSRFSAVSLHGQAMSELLEVRAADDGSQLSARLGRSLAKVVPQLVGAGAAAGAEAANEQQQQPQQQQ